MARLTAPNGATVEVADKRVENLLRRGFTQAEIAKAPAKKTAAKRAASSKSDE